MATKLSTALKECKGKKGDAWQHCLTEHGIKRKGHHKEHHDDHHN